MEKEAEELLKQDLKSAEDSVNRYVRWPINENQFAALVSFTYNVGAGNLKRSTLLKRVNAGRHNEAAAEFLKWIRAGGRILKGLIRRRASERLLYLQSVSSGRKEEEHPQ